MYICFFRLSLWDSLKFFIEDFYQVRKYFLYIYLIQRSRMSNRSCNLFLQQRMESIYSFFFLKQSALLTRLSLNATQQSGTLGQPF